MSDQTCRIDGCEKPRGGRAAVCWMHIARLRRHGDPNTVATNSKGDPRTRFWSKVDVRGDDQCWMFKGTILSNGYGQFTAGTAFRQSAHRFAYEDKVGPIPAGLTIDHLCNVRACMNPAHLEPVTNSENVRRRHQRERDRKAAV